MTSLATRPDRRRPSPVGVDLLQQPSPGLLYHKWQEWKSPDARPARGERERDPKLTFLEEVASAVDAVVTGASRSLYENWLAGYQTALTSLGAETARYRTSWRLVSGMASNPSFETGIDLHPLLGFPYLPGSAVKGLVRHVAEARLCEGREVWLASPASALAPQARGEVEAFLTAAETVRELLGSLAVEEKDRPNEADFSIKTPASLLRAWLAVETWPEGWEDLRERAEFLASAHTGGRLVFYDAVPAQGQTRLLETDILNPHYPEYYRTSGKKPPSDDQDPVPVSFLAVRPGVELLFAFRWKGRRGESRETTREEAEADLAKVRDWLRSGLEERGAGAKTAAGYGYFLEPGEDERPEEENEAEEIPATPQASALARELSAALGEETRSDQEKPEVRKGQRLQAEVVAQNGWQCTLRLVDLDQEITCRVGRTMTVGQGLKVRVKALDRDGGVKEVIP